MVLKIGFAKKDADKAFRRKRILSKVAVSLTPN
jgi:hypothetical protein